MNKKSLILLLVSVFIAAATALAVRARLHEPEAQIQAKQETGKVLVASAAIPAGGFIRPDTELKWSSWPKDTLQPDYVIQGTRTAEEFSGAVARRPINPGEPITDQIVVKKSEGGFMAAVLAPGSRATSIAVNPISGNAGFIFPGDFVDLIVTQTIPVGTGGNQNTIDSQTFMENIRVLAVDQMLNNPENKAIVAKTVTLEVSQKQAEMVAAATEMGKISLSLRSLANPGQTLKEGVSSTQAMPTTAEALRATPENGTRYNSVVNVIRGDKAETMQFNQGIE